MSTWGFTGTLTPSALGDKVAPVGQGSAQQFTELGMPEEPWQPAGVQEDGALARDDLTVGHELGQARERPSGVSRVEEEPLGPGSEQHRVPGCRSERGVSVTDLVPVDLQAIQSVESGESVHSGERGRHAFDDVAHRRCRIWHRAGVDPHHTAHTELCHQAGPAIRGLENDIGQLLVIVVSPKILLEILGA